MKTLIYASAVDEKRDSYTCRSLWIDPSLDGKYAPSPLAGEDVGDGIIVDWEQSPLAGFSENVYSEFDKEHYLDLVDPIVMLVTESLMDIGQALHMWQSGDNIKAGFLLETEPARQHISDAYDAYTSSSGAPYECHDLDLAIGNMLADAHNVAIYHNKLGVERWAASVRLCMTVTALDDANKGLNRIKYEREKIS